MLLSLNMTSVYVKAQAVGFQVPKANIDTETLSNLIQMKQEEVKKKVFRNMIVNRFNTDNWQTQYVNFTSYYYFYDMMEVLTTEKNKSAISRKVIDDLGELAAVYSCAAYVYNEMYKADDFKNSDIASIQDAKGLKEIITKVRNEDKMKQDRASLAAWNLVLDMCFDIILKEPLSLREGNNLYGISKFFNIEIEDEDMQTWYNEDNTYYRLLDGKRASNERELYGEKVKDKRSDFEKYVETKADFTSRSNTEISSYTASLKQVYSDSLNKIYSKTIANKSDLDKKVSDEVDKLIKKEKDSIEKISKLRVWRNSCEEFRNKAKTVVQKFIELDEKFVQKIDKAGVSSQEFVNYFKIMKKEGKSKFANYEITDDQLAILKSILKEFSNYLENKFEQNILSNVLDIISDNIEIVTNDEGVKLMLKINAESFISYFYDKYSSYITKGGKYFSPELSIGMSYSKFNSSSDLVDESGQNLNNLYFASEKLGVRWKIANLKYTRSIDPGVGFKYYCNDNAVWLRPQPKPTVNEVYLSLYASGILYNIANIKSEKNFNQPLLGAALGVSFFNDLCVSINGGFAVSRKAIYGNNSFIALSFDIPLAEYLKAQKEKVND